MNFIGTLPILNSRFGSRQIDRDSGQFGNSSLQKAPLRFLLRQAERSLIGSAGVKRSPEAATEIGPRRMRKVVILQLAARKQAMDETQPRRWTIAHGQSDGAI